jgi:CheY-like chemotaxis protein
VNSTAFIAFWLCVSVKKVFYTEGGRKANQLSNSSPICFVFYKPVLLFYPLYFLFDKSKVEHPTRAEQLEKDGVSRKALFVSESCKCKLVKMKINTLIVDDDPHWRLVIEKFASANPIVQVVGSCASALEAYGKLMENEIDLLICDIEMPDMTGLELVKSLKSPPSVIFATAHRDYALDCFEVSPIDFLLKPLEFPRFLKAIIVELC